MSLTPSCGILKPEDRAFEACLDSIVSSKLEKGGVQHSSLTY